MSTENIETKCPFMQTGGFICIKRKCAMYVDDKCSIAYLPDIAKGKQVNNESEEMPAKVFNAIDWLNNEQGALKAIAESLKGIKAKQETLEKTLATLKKEFAEFEKQAKKRNK